MPEHSGASKKRELTVKNIPGSDELFIEFTPDLLDQLGWLVGDTLRWDVCKTKNEAAIVNLSKNERDAAARSADAGIKW